MSNKPNISSGDRGKKGSILVIDDNRANVDLLARVLSENDYVVHSAFGGAQALQRLQSMLPDLILLDIRMPEMDGYEVCRQFKADVRVRDVPVIFISGMGEVIDKVRAFGMGGVDYITKPFQFEEVLARVGTHIKLRESQRQLKNLSSQILIAQERERKWVANNIHDGVAQSLCVIRSCVENAIQQMKEGKTAPNLDTLEELMRTTNFAIEEVRSIYTGLRPPLLDDLGALVTIKWLLKELRRVSPSIVIEERLEVQEDEIPQSLSLVIFRVLQEATDNIARHSEATCAWISLYKEDHSLYLTIEDNGSGFDRHTIPFIDKGALGLATMQERVESSCGIFTVKSAKGMGTTIQALWHIG